MKRLLMASMLMRALLSTIFAALIVGAVPMFAIFNAKTEWKEAVESYDKYYSGGDQARCENLFSKFALSQTQPACEWSIPPKSDSKPVAKALSDLESELKKFKECNDSREAIRQKDIHELWSSGCPINKHSWGSQTDAPTLGTLYAPGTLWEFALLKSSISSGILLVSFPLTAIFLLLSTVSARSIYMESHLGWKRLTIVLSFLLSPIPLVFYAQTNRPNPIAATCLLIFGLWISASLLVVGRKVVVWIRSGFSSHAAVIQVNHPLANSPVAAPRESGNYFNNDTSTDLLKKYEEVNGKADEVLGAQRQALLSHPLAGPWRRFFARTIDIWLLTMPVAFASGSLLAPTFSENPYTFGLILLPFVMFFEAVISAVFGNSPGKALLAIRVTTIGGGRLSFNDYCRRGVQLYIFGIALGIPFVSLFPMIKQYQNLNAGRPAVYDHGLFSVRVSDLGMGRKVIAGVVLLALFSVPGCISAINQ